MWKSLLLAVAVIAPLVASVTGAIHKAQAQDLKPVAVVAVASVEETLADIGYITATAGMEDTGKTARLFGSALTAGMDKKRPAGMYVVPKDGDFHAIAFIPVTNLKQLLEIHKEYIGEPRDVGDGILEIGIERSAFVKEAGGWAFVAESSDHLTDLPKDPSTLLADLGKKYNVAGKVLVQNVPQELRQTAIDEIKVGLERAMENQPGNVDRAALEKTTKDAMKQIEQLFNEADELTVGLAIDAAAKKTYLDVNVTAKAGTELAKQMALNAEAKTDFAGVLLPEAAVTINMATKLSEADIARMGSTFATLKSQMSAQIDDDPNLAPEQRTVAKEVIGKLLDVFEQTAKTGKLDAGAALVLEPKSLNFVMGGFVADGPAFEKSLKEVLELAKNEPNVPKVQFNAGKLGNLALHKTSIPVPADEAEAREILGEKLDVVLGVGPQSIFVTAGKGGEALLKKVIDQSAASAGKPVPPAQINVALLPILKFSASMDPSNPILPALVASLEKSGNDRLIMTSQGSANGSHMRIEIQEGIIRMGGEAARQVQGGQLPGAE
jgi:hypothetical protein